MLKKIFTLFAVLITAAQFSVASADIAVPDYFEPINPIRISVETVEKGTPSVILGLSSKLPNVESYRLKVYRNTNTEELLLDTQGNFQYQTATAKFEYNELLKDMPDGLNIYLEIFVNEKMRYQRPIIPHSTYEVTFIRQKDELKSKVNLVSEW